MDDKERLQRLKQMLLEIAPEPTLESLPAPKRRRRRARPPAGVVEPVSPFEMIETVSEGDEADAIKGLQKLKEGRDEDVTPVERQVLEAIVMPQNRPVAFVRNGTYDDIEAPWTHLNVPAVRARLVPLLPSIGRVELPTMPQIPFGGTAFVVGRNLLMTNRHVARIFAEGLGVKRIRYIAGDAAVDFHREVGSPAGDRSAFFDVIGVAMIHPFWDMALLRVEPLTRAFEPLTLSILAPDELVGKEVLAVGYPARDDRNDLDLQDDIFDRQYNVKRAQPGKIRARATIQSFENIVSAMTHDSSTLGGNSGSAVIDIASGQIVGLHFAGEYLKANYAVPLFELARDSRVVGAGLNFAGSVPPTSDWDSAWRRAGSDESTIAVPAAPVVPPAVAQSAQPAAQPAPGTVSFTVPLQISIALGGAAGPGTGAMVAIPAPALPVSEAPRLAIPVIFDDLESRAGYQPDFLGLARGEKVPLPKLTERGKRAVAKLEDGSSELKYHKFSVVMHKGRRLALFTAANVDWRREQRTIDGERPTRAELTGLPDGTAERWVTDSRIGADHQLPDVFLTNDGAAFDKGHLVRRDDVCWGDTFEDMQMANGDTFHTTNCSPQVSLFNRASLGIDNWGDLENLVQAQTQAERAIVFSGPVLARSDRLFAGRSDAGALLVRVPRAFWKVVVVKGTDGPEAYGFVLEQDLSDVPLREEFAVPARWRRHMLSLSDIEDRLYGLATIDWLKEHDRFGATEGVRLRSALEP